MQSLVEVSLIGQLYALRAGLSVVSQEKDEADRILREANSTRKARNAEYKEKTERINNSISDAENNIMVSRDNIERMDEIINSKYSVNFQEIVAVLTTMLLVLVVIALVALAVCFFLFVACTDLEAFGEQWDTIPFFKAIFGWTVETPSKPGRLPEVKGAVSWLEGAGIIFGILTLGVAVGVGYLCYLSIQWYDDNHFPGPSKARKQAAMKKKAKYKKQAQMSESNYQLLQAQREKWRVEEAVAYQELETLISEAKAAAGEHVEAAVALVDILNESFGDMLDMRDWKHLDLVIFAIETHRADTVRGALLDFVDREERVGKLADAISTASREIQRTLNNGFNLLREDVNRGFSAISEQINLSTRIMANEMGAMRSQMSFQAQQLGYISSELNLSNALLTKANVTSMRLAEDVRQIRSNSDYANLRLRGY